MSEKIQHQLAVLNARVQNVNLTFNDLLRDMNELFKTYVARIAELEKENADLKAKPKETQKTK
jgi:hypothetical protein